MEVKMGAELGWRSGIGYGSGLVYGLMGGRYGFEDFVLLFALLGLYISKIQYQKGLFLSRTSSSLHV
jgi:hypothetical protein